MSTVASVPAMHKPIQVSEALVCEDFLESSCANVRISTVAQGMDIYASIWDTVPVAAYNGVRGDAPALA